MSTTLLRKSFFGLAALFSFTLVSTLTNASQISQLHLEPYLSVTSLSNNMNQPYYATQYLLSNELASHRGIELVVSVQQALAAREYYTGDIDGIVGLQTETALFLFQMDQDLLITGSINCSTLESLHIPSPEWLNR